MTKSAGYASTNFYIPPTPFWLVWPKFSQGLGCLAEKKNTPTMSDTGRSPHSFRFDIRTRIQVYLPTW